MAKKLYEENNIIAIANTIRDIRGDDSTYYVADMPDAIGMVYQDGRQTGYAEGRQSIINGEARDADDISGYEASQTKIDVTVKAGYYAADTTKQMDVSYSYDEGYTEGSSDGYGDGYDDGYDDGYEAGQNTGGGTQTAPTISVSTSGLITATADGKSSTKQLSTVAGKTVTPTTYNLTAVGKNYFTTGAVVVKGDAYLFPNNIKKGVTIFGKVGTFDNYELGMLDAVPGKAQNTGTTFDTTDYGGGYTAYTANTFSGVYKPTVTHSGIQYTLNSWISATTEGDQSNPYLIRFTNKNRTFRFRLFVKVICSWDQHLAREEFYEVVEVPADSSYSVEFSFDDGDDTLDWTYEIEGAFAYDL